MSTQRKSILEKNDNTQASMSIFNPKADMMMNIIRNESDNDEYLDIEDKLSQTEEIKGESEKTIKHHRKGPTSDSKKHITSHSHIDFIQHSYRGSAKKTLDLR